MKPEETIAKVMHGRAPKLLMDIHDVSDVNEPDIDLSAIPGPATSETFEKDKLDL
jgi:NADH-quinone oxidoreductase subunit G